eukprot:scaffold991_cov128-Cylindrotheca_fusiformis.AAC.36
MESEQGERNEMLARKKRKPDANNDDLDDQESSRLSSIARTFLQLVQVSPGHQVQLDQAASILNVSKSKIEDVSSILEGVGYVEQLSTDIVKLSDSILRHQQVSAEQRKLAMRLEQVINEEATIDSWITYLQSLRSDPSLIDTFDANESPRRTTPQGATWPSIPTTSNCFRQCRSPLQKVCITPDRLVQVSSEDTEESTLSTSSAGTLESFLHTRSIPATTKNASRKRVLLLSNITVRDSASKKRFL